MVNSRQSQAHARADHRILSALTQIRFLNVSEANLDKNGTLTDLKRFLMRFNPWRKYNYHTGRYMEGSCPMSAAENLLVKPVNPYDIILDAN